MLPTWIGREKEKKNLKKMRSVFLSGVPTPSENESVLLFFWLAVRLLVLYVYDSDSSLFSPSCAAIRSPLT